MPRRSPVRSALATALVVALAGCATGQRPHFAEPDPFPAGAVTNDPATDAVLALLDRAGATGPADALGTYEYEVFQRFGGQRHEAAVTTIDDERRIVVGSVTFIESTTGAQTCPGVVPATCVDGLQQNLISDTGVNTVNFWGADTARRLRRKSAGKIGPGVASAPAIAGQPATCVTLPFGDNQATFCAFDRSGMLAKLDDSDVLVEAVSAPAL